MRSGPGRDGLKTKKEGGFGPLDHSRLCHVQPTSGGEEVGGPGRDPDPRRVGSEIRKAILGGGKSLAKTGEQKKGNFREKLRKKSGILARRQAG